MRPRPGPRKCERWEQGGCGYGCPWERRAVGGVEEVEEVEEQGMLE
jgi:hypothetical protein